MIKTSDCDFEQLERLLTGIATDVEQQAIERHLTGCLACREELDRRAAGPDMWRDAREHLSSGEIRVGSASAARHALETSSRSLEVVFESDERDLHDERDERDEQADDRQAAIAVVLRALAPSDDPAMLGRLGGHEISGVVGAGGMGVVLKGFDRALNRFVALKVLAPQLATSGTARRRFAREAQAAAAIMHENVVAIHAVAEEAELPYFVMPYLRTGSLQKRLDQHGPLEIREILRIALQVARGLAAAHAQGLVHRDIKPANILVSDNVERVQITDFGLARTIDDASLTRTGVIAGTPLYMSPEQSRGDAVDGRSDLFSLGSVMYAMCTGRPPFRAETTLAVLRRIGEARARPIRELNPSIPAWFERLVERLHEKQPERRYASADELATLLERCLAHLHDPTRQTLPGELVRWRFSWRKTAVDRATVRGLIGLAGVFAASLALSAFWFRPGTTESKTSDSQATVTTETTGRDRTPPSEGSSSPATSFAAATTDPAAISLSRDQDATSDADLDLRWNDSIAEALSDVRNRTLELEQRITGARTMTPLPPGEPAPVRAEAETGDLGLLTNTSNSRP